MCMEKRFDVKVTEEDWSQDESLVALQTSPKPPPNQRIADSPLSPLAEGEVEEEPAGTPA